jgi:protein-tyrosine-phosphatase/DNA-binding transcriptional ArsR family regulator
MTGLLDPSKAFAALGHDTRLEIVRILERAHPLPRSAGEIARLVAVLPATLSAQLAILEEAGLITSRREGRSILYAIVPKALSALADAVPAPRPAERLQPTGDPLSVLFVCTGNSARSIMAEALLTRFGAGRFRAASAGSRPRGAVEPEVLRLLGDLGYDTAALVSKGWTGVADTTPDVVVTLCDEAAGEACPSFIGPALTAHWGIADPVASPPEARRGAVRDAYRHLSARVTELIALPVETLTRAEFAAALNKIAVFGGATPLARLRAAS